MRMKIENIIGTGEKKKEIKKSHEKTSGQER
jgi:hypothetical protein